MSLVRQTDFLKPGSWVPFPFNNHQKEKKTNKQTNKQTNPQPFKANSQNSKS